ncbi:MAG: HAD-IA family hydrolase [Gallionella sp.]
MNTLTSESGQVSNAVVKAILFDLDGTFADTAPDLAAALNHVRATKNLPPLPLTALRPQASHGSIGLLKVGMNVTPNSPDFQALRDIFLDHYANHICVNTKLFSGMPELITELEQRNIAWGIITNKPHRFTVPLMEALGYAHRAVCLISGDTCSHAKPHPEPMLAACKLIKIAPVQCLYLGDDKRDMEAANAANMRGIIANYGYVSDDVSVQNWQAHGSVDNPMELLTYLNL